MFDFRKPLLAVLSLWHTFKNEHTRWRLDTHADHAQLKHQQAMAEQTLIAELKIRSAHLEHELTILKTTHEAQLSILKTKCQQDIKDYKQYLEALEQLKISMQKSFAHLPDAVAFTIHHHAKNLLNAMWEADSLDEKMRQEMQLIQLMSTVHEDARLYLAGESHAEYPEKTLQLLQNKSI